MWRLNFRSRQADWQQLAEEIRLRARAEAERDALRERLTDAERRFERLEGKHEALIAQVVGREAAIAYPTDESRKPQRSTPLGRVISALNTREFHRAPSQTPSTEPVMSSS